MNKTMDLEEPMYKGLLLLPPVGKLLKKSWQQRYCLIFKASKFGRERLEVYESVDSKESKIITLEDCIKINSKSPTTFGVTTRTAVHEFGALNEHSMKEWLSAIRSVAFPEEASKLTSIEEDNDLYCSSGQGVFNVKLHPSPVSVRCGLESKNYTLVLTSTAIQLMNIADNKLLYTWPYCYIRRYGYQSDKFTFEAGRKCESGEGTFFLENPNQQEIFRCLATKMKSMKKMLAGESSPVLDCGDALHAALTMEARSRTPLPPSPTAPSLQDCTISSKSQFVSSENDLIKPKPFVKPNINMLPAVKAKPMKPPRKYAPKPPPDSDPTYEPIDRKYDEVEIKCNAWQTLGTDPPSHTETISDDAEYSSWGEVKQESEILKQKQPLAPAIITRNTTGAISGRYDKLNFFGSTSKLNANSPYKQVFPIPVNSSFEPPSFNDYDEVQCLNTEVHSAEKEVIIDPKEKRDAKVNHQFHNEEAYAVITKPKRV
ncbi:docking protein homolog [Leptinotarsa decemlineata]|uniref:docking protein homolog n=1 Tax=Leptinotarsa decemlineata TaxID=7539 RepID=UPI003D307A4C